MSNIAEQGSLLRTSDDPGAYPLARAPTARGPAASPLQNRQVADDPAWQVSSNLLRGWREVVAFDSAGAAIIGDFTITRSANVDVSVGNQVFIQLLLNGHDILPAVGGRRESAVGKMLFGRLRADEQTSFVLPDGGRWRSLYVGISDRAVEHLWGLEPDRLIGHLRAARDPDATDELNICEYGGYVSVEKRGMPEQIFNCALPAIQRKAFIWSRSLELMVDIVSNILADGAGDVLSVSRSRSAVLAARDVVHQEIGQPHTIDSLSFRVGLSRREFMSCFKEEFGVTFHDYYMQVRMSRAAALLSEARIRVTDVSEQVGYTQLSSFSRAFKAFYGVSPCAFHDLSPRHIS